MSAEESGLEIERRLSYCETRSLNSTVEGSQPSNLASSSAQLAQNRVVAAAVQRCAKLRVRTLCAIWGTSRAVGREATAPSARLGWPVDRSLSAIARDVLVARCYLARKLMDQHSGHLLIHPAWVLFCWVKGDGVALLRIDESRLFREETWDALPASHEAVVKGAMASNFLPETNMSKQRFAVLAMHHIFDVPHLQCPGEFHFVSDVLLFDY